MRVAAVQLNAGADPDANLRAADAHVRAAAADGARLVVLPEKWLVLGPPGDLRAGAQPLDGPAVQWARDTARELRIDLVAGSISERVDGADRLRNTSLHVGPDGEVKAVYRKIHMFDVVVDGREYRESKDEEPGDEIVTSATADGVGLGLSICYDLRFPELYRALARRGARILVVPAAFTLATTRDHWEVLVRARAIEQQAFVIAANQIGAHPGGMRSGGRSLIVDPWGVVLATAPDRVGHVVADLDLDAQERIRRDLPSLANARLVADPAVAPEARA
ncbi:MAG: carbon-nitrogen hydrolase family protein [Solirubrobacteraceae bacterium]|nr:carbon-nitrogen hydrolase family protein [Solirubrobacteraceae bacterium]